MFEDDEDFSEDSLDDDSRSMTPVDDVSQSVYIKACSLFKVTPCNYFYRSLTAVDIPLQNHAVGAVGAKAIATALVTNTTVKHVNLASNGMGEVGLAYILDMLNENRTITDINLSNNEILSNGCKLLSEAFVRNENIRILDISGNDFKDEDSACLAAILEENAYLQEFHVSRNSFGEVAGINFGKALEFNSSLRHFDISWNHLRQRGAIELSYGIQHNIGLQTLNLSWNGFGMEGCHELGKALQVNRSLTDLDIASNRVSYDAFKLLLRGLVKNRSLKTLKIGFNPLTTDGANAILRAVSDERCGSLSHLDMSDVSVDNDFLSLLNDVQKHRSLHVNHGITLRHDDIKKGDRSVVLDTDDPVTILFECVKTKNLRLIDLLKNLDKDNSDTLSREEIRRGLEEIDIPLSQRSMDILMKRLDINKDGFVDFAELTIKYKEHLRRVAKLRVQAGVDLKHYKNFDRMEQLREAVRMRLTMGASSSQTT